MRLKLECWNLFQFQYAGKNLSKKYDDKAIYNPPAQPCRAGCTFFFLCTTLEKQWKVKKKENADNLTYHRQHYAGLADDKN